MSHHDWYRSFFSGVVVDSWVNMVPPEQTVAEVRFIERALGGVAGKRILDVPSGHARHALLLAERGAIVTGADISEEFLAIARGRAAAAGFAIDWRRLDMSEDLPPGPFDGVITCGNAFGYFDAGRMRRFIALVASRLVRGGRWVFDSGAIAESILPNLKAALEFEKDGLAMRFENTYVTLDSRLETTCTFVRNGVTDVRVFSHWVYTLGEIRRLLEEAGLQVIDVARSPVGEPYRRGDPFALVVSEKV